MKLKPLSIVLIFSFLSFSLLLAVESNTLSNTTLPHNKQSILKPAKQRQLGIKVNLGKDRDFDKVFKESLKAGNQTQVIPLDWNEIETASGRYEPKINFLAIANQYYAAYQMPVHLSIRPIHTNRKTVPADLITKTMDNPEVIQRFQKLLDWVALQIPKLTVTSISIGAEVDIYMWGSKKRWQSWKGFYKSVAAYARKKFPATLITFETTQTAFTNYDIKWLHKIHQYSDAIGVSYYPMKSQLSAVKPPTVVHQDFLRIIKNIKNIKNKPILFYQIGYPSSSYLDSSEVLQAQFIHEAFQAWDNNSQRILLLNFQWMHETPDSGLNKFAKDYDNHSKNFRKFLGSLGLKSWEGKPKKAWHRLEKEAQARQLKLH